jgi:hypothetical protein
MTVGPVLGRAPIPARTAHAHTPVARWAVGLATVSAVLLVVWFVPWVATASSTIMAVAIVCLSAGVLAAFTAFVMAVLARARHERWTLLWIPLTMFPVLVALPGVFVLWLMAGGA